MLKTIALALAFLPVVASAAEFHADDRGTTTAAFLKLAAGARGASMGEAQTASAEPAEALYWNPAGLTAIESKTATFMHAAYLESTSFQYAAYGQKLQMGGAFGASIQRFSAGSIDETDTTGTRTGSFTPTDMALTVGYAREIHGFSAGVSAKYISSKVATTATTEALDAGVISPAYLDGKLKLAFAIANFGLKLKFDEASEPLPFYAKFGSAYKITGNLLATADVSVPRDNQPLLGVGTEYVYAVKEGQQLTGRAGYNTRSTGDVSGFTGFSFGLGFGFEKYSLDYAMVPFGDLGTTHRISVGARF